MARIEALDPRYPTLNPGAVRVVGGQFVEADGGADDGTYRLAIKIPAYAVIIDAIVHNEVAWDAGTDALLNAGWYSANATTGAISTVIDADDMFAACSLKATDLLAGQSIRLFAEGGKGGDMTDTATHVLDSVDSVDRWLVFDVLTTGTAGSAGLTYVYVVYGVPEMTPATFTAT